MDCPVCGVPLIVVERSNIELDYCLTCHGFWFDEGEIELVPDALGLASSLPPIGELPVAASGEAARPCPRCGRKMDKAKIGDAPPVLVDRCPQGEGLWFDRGELGLALDQHARRPDAGGEVLSFLGETFGTAGR